MPTSDQPIIRFFDGREGIKTIYRAILDAGKPLCAVSNTHYVFDVLPHFVPRFIRQRVARGISIRLLNEDTQKSRELMRARDRKELRQTRFLPQLAGLKITQYVFGANVAVLSTDPKEPYGYIVAHEDYARAQQLLFDLLWKGAAEQ